MEDARIIDSIEWNECHGGRRKDGKVGLYWHIAILFGNTMERTWGNWGTVLCWWWLSYMYGQSCTL